MRYTLATDAKPQMKLLLIATLITIAIWFIPYAEYIVYPIRLFVTFVHEASHALVAVLTGGSVQSLTISADGSGVVYSAPSGLLGALLTSSAGYLSTTFVGVLMLYLIRRNISPHKILLTLGAFVVVITVVFGIVSPLFNFFSLNVAFSSVAFTVIVGLLLAAGMIAIALYSSFKVANFAVAFLAVQCLLNALSDLKTLFFINAPLVGSDISTDAANMAAATGIPGIVWVAVWIAIALFMIVVGIRFYAIRKASPSSDSLFED
jgi:hypothetical protein